MMQLNIDRPKKMRGEKQRVVKLAVYLLKWGTSSAAAAAQWGGGEKLSCTALICLPIVQWLCVCGEKVNCDGAVEELYFPAISPRPIHVGLEQISIKPPKSRNCPS